MPIGVNSCTAGLHLALLAAGIGPGDEVITSPLTFAATANVIVHVGATPVLADIRYDDLNIDPEQIERRITPRTKAIMPVHYAGQACRMDEILDIAKRHNLYVIEDAATAAGAGYKGRQVGALGDATVVQLLPGEEHDDAARAAWSRPTTLHSPTASAPCATTASIPTPGSATPPRTAVPSTRSASRASTTACPTC